MTTLFDIGARQISDAIPSVRKTCRLSVTNQTGVTVAYAILSIGAGLALPAMGVTVNYLLLGSLSRILTANDDLSESERKQQLQHIEDDSPLYETICDSRDS